MNTRESNLWLRGDKFIGELGHPGSEYILMSKNSLISIKIKIFSYSVYLDQEELFDEKTQ